MFIGFEDVVDEDDDIKDNTVIEETNAPIALDKEITIDSPLDGKAIELSKVNDSTFSNEILGKGVAIIPEEGVVYAPFDGKIDVFFQTGHAIGLVNNEGTEVLIHVGIDTVNLNGEFFHPQKQSGDEIKKGEVLLKFDMDKIKEAGYDVVTPVIISNTNDYVDVTTVSQGNVSKLQPILCIK